MLLLEFVLLKWINEICKNDKFIVYMVVVWKCKERNLICVIEVGMWMMYIIINCGKFVLKKYGLVGEKFVYNFIV